MEPAIRFTTTTMGMNFPSIIDKPEKLASTILI
jgi:hypothetical protein